MNRGIILKAVHESAGVTALLAAALMLVEAILAYVLPTFVEGLSGTLLQLEFFRTIIQAMLGTDVGEYLSPEAFSAIAWVHPVVLAIFWTHAILFCTRVPVGEIDRGTIDVLFGLPVSRFEVYASETVVFFGTGVVVVIMGLLGHRLGIMSVAAARRPGFATLLVVVANLYCLYLAVGGLAYLVSSMSNRRGRAIGIVFALLLASFLLNFLAQFWEPAKKIAFLSVLNYYQPLLVLRDAAGGSWPRFPVADMLTLAIAGCVLWTAGAVCFARRDICTV